MFLSGKYKRDRQWIMAISIHVSLLLGLRSYSFDSRRVQTIKELKVFDEDMF